MQKNIKQNYFKKINIKNKGFTLIEILVVVVIIGILISIAVPAYTQYVLRSRRADAVGGLSEASQILERCYTVNFSYNSANCPAIAAETTNGYYTMTLTAAANTYTITAVPTAGSPQLQDKDCQEFAINNNGNKTASNEAGVSNGAVCWNLSSN